jgi:peptide methionine sulfoxide reductase msrA/msrB
VVSGEALFSSLDKYDSGSGWPSFVRPIESSALNEKVDHRIGLERIEVQSQKSGSHLGHVFDDGPLPTGKRFCINSAALRFVPVSELQAQGYGKYLFQFAQKKGWQIATLAGGCFWGMESILKKVSGVIETQVGYTGGNTHAVTYEEVSTGKTGHAESIQILFDPKKVSYENILIFYFKIHDPTTANQQGNDIGTQYRSAIFFANDDQKKIAETIKQRVEKSGKWKKPVVTQIAPLSQFIRAEEYHQKYHEKHPHGYTCHYIRKIEF